MPGRKRGFEEHLQGEFKEFFQGEFKDGIHVSRGNLRILSKGEFKDGIHPRMGFNPGIFSRFHPSIAPLAPPLPRIKRLIPAGFVFFFFQDPFGEKRGHFDYQALLLRLQGIRQRVQDKHQQESAEMDSESSSSEPETDTQGCSKA